MSPFSAVEVLYPRCAAACVRCDSPPAHQEGRHVATTTIHRTLLTLHLGVVAALEAALGHVDAAPGQALAPIQARAHLLTTMPGVSDLVAHVVVAGIGVGMALCRLHALGYDVAPLAAA